MLEGCPEMLSGGPSPVAKRPEGRGRGAVKVNSVWDNKDWKVEDTFLEMPTFLAGISRLI